MPAAVVRNPVFPNGCRFGRTSRIYFGGDVIRPFVSKAGMPDLVRNEESLLESAPIILVTDRAIKRSELGPTTVQRRASRCNPFDFEVLGTRDGIHQGVGVPGVGASRYGGVVKRRGALPCQFNGVQRSFASGKQITNAVVVDARFPQ